VLLIESAECPGSQELLVGESKMIDGVGGDNSCMRGGRRDPECLCMFLPSFFFFFSPRYQT
jgi:hypothetical protein